MLCLSEEKAKELVEHSKRECPDEACGILAGRGGKVEKVYQMASIDKSSKTFFMDPREQLKVMKEITNSGLEMVGIYHSHIEVEPYPSAHDVELAFYPEVSYVIVSTKDNTNIRSFKIIEGEISEEEVKIE